MKPDQLLFRSGYLPYLNDYNLDLWQRNNKLYLRDTNNILHSARYLDRSKKLECKVKDSLLLEENFNTQVFHFFTKIKHASVGVIINDKPNQQQPYELVYKDGRVNTFYQVSALRYPRSKFMVDAFIEMFYRMQTLFPHYYTKYKSFGFLNTHLLNFQIHEK